MQQEEEKKKSERSLKTTSRLRLGPHFSTRRWDGKQGTERALIVSIDYVGSSLEQ